MVLAQDHNHQLRKCTKCGGEFPATPEYFHRANSRRDGLHPWCKGCERERQRNDSNAKKRQKAWREAHPDRAREYQRAYREAHLDQCRERSREWQKNNPERARESSRVYRESHPDRYRLWYQKNIERERNRLRKWQSENRELVRQRLRDWRKANPDRKRAYDKKWREANPDYHREYSNRPEIKARAAVYAHNRRARELSLRNDFTASQREFAIEYFDHCCAYCGRQFYDLFGDHALAFDHFIPISSPECPGTTVTNMLPTCHGLDGCNSRKSNSDPMEWVIQRFGKRKGRTILSRIADYFEIANSRWFTADAETKP